jgi:hypothetical protein
MVVETDATLGRAMWHMLHVIAANFPDGKPDGLTQQRLRGYYNFFNSLKHVLPRDSWRDTWRISTSFGEHELSWPRFQVVRSHKELSKWLFGVHDEVRTQLKQPLVGGSTSKERTLTWYAKYAQYRSGRAGRANSRSTNNASGIARIREMISRRTTAMNDFMKIRYPDYATWTYARQRATREKHFDEAARWFWSDIRDKLSANEGWDSMSVAAQRDAVVTQFNYMYRLHGQKLGNFAKKHFFKAGEFLDSLRSF